MIRALKGVAVIGCALPFFAAAALAQAPDTTVVVPWGDTLAEILTQSRDGLTVLLLGALTAAVAKFPGWVQGIIATAKVNQLLEKAIDFGINTTIGAVKGETLTVDVGNKVVKQAVDYVMKHAPDRLIGWMGGEDMIKEKVIARVEVGKGAALTP